MFIVYVHPICLCWLVPYLCKARAKRSGSFSAIFTNYVFYSTLFFEKKSSKILSLSLPFVKKGRTMKLVYDTYIRSVGGTGTFNVFLLPHTVPTVWGWQWCGFFTLFQINAHLLWHPVAISVSCVDRDLYCWGLALCVYVALPVTVGGLSEQTPFL